MAGEWFPVDVNLAEKPEVLELCEITGLDVEVVVFRLFRLWGWFQMHSSNGDARVTLKRFTSVAGGDAEFWKAVTQVGWLEETKTGIRIPKWDERFSNAAKSKKRAAMRQKRHRQAVTLVSRSRNAEALPDKIREDKIREEEKHTHTHTRAENDFPERGGGWASEAWESFASRWNSTERARPWTALTAPDGWVDLAGRPGWLEKAGEALDRLPGCNFFEQPLAVTKFFEFVDRILAGEFDHAKTNGRPRRQLAKGRL